MTDSNQDNPSRKDDYLVISLNTGNLVKDTPTSSPRLTTGLLSRLKENPNLKADLTFKIGHPKTEYLSFKLGIENIPNFTNWVISCK